MLIVLSFLIIVATFILYKGYRVGLSPTSSVSLVSLECFFEVCITNLKVVTGRQEATRLVFKLLLFLFRKGFPSEGLGMACV